MFTEDLTPLFADFGVDATLAGSPVRAIVDTASVVEVDGVLTQAPSAELSSAQSAAAAPGQAFVANATNYTVRQVLRAPPDGVLTRLVLARA